MAASFIAAIIILLILNIFVLYMINILIAQTKRHIQEKVVTEIETYDHLIDAKEERLISLKKDIDKAREVKEELERKEATDKTDRIPDPYMPQPTDYCITNFSMEYRNIKEQFAMDKNAVVKRISQIEQDAEQLRVSRIANEILEEVSFENVFGLSELHVKDQKSVWESVLTDDELQLYKEYQNSHVSFDSTQFYYWLNAMKERQMECVCVYTAEKEEDYQTIGENVRTIYDPNLCEGIQVKYGTSMYDYGLLNSELQ